MNAWRDDSWDQYVQLHLHQSRLDLADAGLEHIPVQLAKLESLTELDLSFNQIQEIPTELFDLVELRSLNLSHNRIRNIPDQITRCEELVHLDLRNNLIEIMPQSFQDMNIDSLRVQNNPLITRNKASESIDLVFPSLKELTANVIIRFGPLKIAQFQKEENRCFESSRRFEQIHHDQSHLSRMRLSIFGSIDRAKMAAHGRMVRSNADTHLLKRMR
eukprot:TRINITY_DN1486_c0_g2_i2.p1 TRINITY_DN1486_c0_g2~~TRINITY_DN1486_c0_g2_i2.p1  ORF type:complete len:217 (+),score=37.39 TRINITY_DN1486_c0_g2_i2:2-652(+)